MKKVVAISSHNRFSVGNIMLNISAHAAAAGYKAYTFSPRSRTQKVNVPNHFFFGNIPERNISNIINIQTGKQGALNYVGTYELLRKLNHISPDIIHLHNLHSNYVNLRMLFRYINEKNIPVVWTFHDCWPFTGQCPYFDIVDCKKWKMHCEHCAMCGEYPQTKKDRSFQMYDLKKQLFTSVSDMTIITPSDWLRALVMESFLSCHDVRVINNGVDQSIFKPIDSTFRKDHGLEGKFIILGVASAWGERKGLDRFIALSKRLDSRFKIVLVGIEQGELNAPDILCIKKTLNQAELAKIYTAADVLLNPTREDNFPTVNIEALSCGTPVISYGAGGSAEAFDDATGRTISEDNVEATLDELFWNNYQTEACINRAKNFDEDLVFDKYIRLYDEILNRRKQ